MLNLSTLLVLAAQLGVTANPFEKKSLGQILASELGPRLIGPTGRPYYQAGEYRIQVKPEVPLKESYSISALVAKVDFKSMKAGQAFLIAE